MILVAATTEERDMDPIKPLCFVIHVSLGQSHIFHLVFSLELESCLPTALGSNMSSNTT